MKKLLLAAAIAVALLLLAATVTGCQPEFQPGTFTDDAGRQVTIDQPPQRIVSHVPSVTEIVYALGLEDRLVAVSDYCEYPPEAKEKPSIGSYFNPSIENIVAMEPDLVLTDGHSETIVPLDELGINYLIIDPATIDEIYESIELIGRATGVQAAAEALTKEMRDSVAKITAKVEGAPPVRVIYLIDATEINNPWTAGPGSFPDRLIAMAGGANVAERAGTAWAQLSIEEIIDGDPEVIILPTAHGTAFTPKEVFEENAAWRETTAVKEGNIFMIDGDLVDGTGPRIVQGLEELAKILHPELFDQAPGP